jgi:type IV secretion system protein TrbL
MALGGTAVAGGMLASGAARLAGRAAGGSLKAAAALTGRVGAAYQAGGQRGVARTAITAPATRLITAGAAPVRDALRRGAAQGYRDAEPEPSDPDRGADALGSSSSRAEPPAWARNLARRQRLTQAGLTAAGALREGDRPVAGGSPDLNDKS